jgi:hypothetical protein
MNNERDKSRNPHNLCTWNSVEECRDCSIGGHLNCRFSAKALLKFVSVFLVFFSIAAIGVIRAGYGWYVLGWIMFMIFYFGFWVTRILCSHCPYYAESSRTLHCIANYGCPKIWEYHPEPMSLSGKVQLLIALTILMGYPFPFLILGRELIFVFVAALSILSIVISLLGFICRRCVNFSCPLNRVPKWLARRYLEMNPIMQQAWEKNKN